MVKLSNS
ncbi:hypothetical protein RDI58_020500 [Solanum bulbocastanum]